MEVFVVCLLFILVMKLSVCCFVGEIGVLSFVL
jgi:hypothetical protein